MMKQAQSGAGATRLLITMPWGIGDAIVVGLSAVDQIRRNDQDGDVEIDILCNQSQTEIFEEDPRIHRIIQVDKKLFTTNEAETWKRGLFLPPGVAKDMYNPRGKDFFDHITSDQLTDAIMSQL